MTDNILEVRDLSVCFGSTRVLSGLSFDVQHGSTLAIIGPNGVGKTVLLKALIGSVASAGDIAWAAGTRIGYVPQKLDLERQIPLTGWDFLRARARLAHAPAEAPIAATHLVGSAADVLERPIGALSGGQFQRLLLAFALLGDPDVLLLDEPTAGVDEAGEERFYETVTRLKRERRMTILFISHELSAVYENADEVLCLARGRAFKGAPRSILTPDLLADVYGSRLRFHVHDG